MTVYLQYLLDLQWVPGHIDNAVVLINFHFYIYIFCFQLEPNKDRCGFLTIPEEWKSVHDIIQQPEEGSHEKGTVLTMYTFKSCSNFNWHAYCVIQHFYFYVAMGYYL